jgi:hypothetical protein
MGLFSLFKPTGQSKAIKGASKKTISTCPVCKSDIGAPTRKKKCPSCKTEIFARSLLDGTKAWLTDEQVKKLNAEREYERKKEYFLNSIQSRSTYTDNESLINKASNLYLNGKRDEAWRALNIAVVEASKHGGTNGNGNLGSAYWDIYCVMGDIVADEKKYNNALSNYILAFYWERVSRIYLEVITGDNIRNLDFKQNLLEASFFMQPFAIILELGNISLQEMKVLFLDVLKNQDKVASTWLKNIAKNFDKMELRNEDLERYIGLDSVWQVLSQALPRWQLSS